MKAKDGQLHLKISSLGIAFFFALFFFPDAFGIRIGIVLNIQRIMSLLLISLIFFNKERRQRMIKIVLGHRDLLIMAAYLFVCFYTMVFRINIGALFNPLMDLFLVYFLVIYLLTYELETERVLRMILLIGTILCILGVFELITKTNLFSYIAFQRGMFAGGIYRDGSYRIDVNGQHPLGYGLFLLLFYPLTCYDFKKSRLDVLRRPILAVLILVNVYATGSRSTLGILCLEIVIILLLSRREDVVKVLVITGPLLLMLVILLIMFSNLTPVQNLLIRIFITLDGALGTDLAGSIMNYHSVLVQGSTDYRTKLPKIFLIGWLNPLVGKGLGYSFSAYIDDVAVRSIDNYYVLTYIQYAYPGLFTFIGVCVSQIRYALTGVLRRRDSLCAAILVAFIGYFINLWFVDTLGTLRFVFVLFGILYVRNNGGRK